MVERRLGYPPSSSVFPSVLQVNVPCLHTAWHGEPSFGMEEAFPG